MGRALIWSSPGRRNTRPVAIVGPIGDCNVHLCPEADMDSTRLAAELKGRVLGLFLAGYLAALSLGALVVGAGFDALGIEDSYADPTNLKQIGDLVELPVGHTTSCVDGCNYVWTGGPARRNDLAYLGPFTPGGRGDGRPIWVTNLKDHAHPETYPKPIDLGRNDGLTDYSHDVDVDSNGVAWISGRGGLLGYATRGKSRDPKTDRLRVAKPWDPVLVAGGGVPGGDDGVAQPQTDFIHNSTRPPSGQVKASGVADGNVALMTEEDFTEPCDQGGRIVAADITSSLGGEGATNSTPEQPFRMTALDSFHPARNASDSSAPITSCSAHYFELSGSTLAAAWYGQGL